MKNSQYVRQAQYKKGFIMPVLLAIIALLVIGGGVYIYKNKKVEAPVVPDTQTQTLDQNQQQTNVQTPSANTQTNTLNWKTYTNTKYGFEIKYPADLKISTFKPGDSNMVFGLKISDNFNLILISNTKDGSKTLQDEKDKLVADYGTDPEAKLVIKDFLIGNSPAFSASFYSIIVGDTGGGKHSTPNFIIETYKDNYFYVLETSTSTSSEIFSTFKFTTTNTTIEKASGIIKSVYNKSGKNYINIDYVEFNPNWVPGGNGEQGYKNDNSLIRTFEISSNAKFFRAGDALITFSDFQRYFTTDTYQKLNPWDIVVTSGVVTQITEHYIP